jgi:hypothetical protein
VSVIELPELARRANDPNRHLVDGPPAPGR